MKAQKKKDPIYDDYEDLLNTIEQEASQQHEPFSSAMTGVRNSQKSLTAEGGPPNFRGMPNTSLNSQHGSTTGHQGGLN